MKDLVLQIQTIMVDKGLTLSTAESCTSGKIASLLTSNDGASQFFIGGIVCYQNRIKEKFLYVSPKTIEKYDVVSREVAIEMVRGICDRMGSDCGISVTGYASKSNNPNIPNGTIHAALNVKGKIKTLKFELNGSRSENLEYVSNEIIKEFHGYIAQLVEA